MLKDPSPIKRAVTGLSWSPDGGTKLAAAYSDPFWKNLFDYKENDSYIWNIGIDIALLVLSICFFQTIRFPIDRKGSAAGSRFT